MYVTALRLLAGAALLVGPVSAAASRRATSAEHRAIHRVALPATSYFSGGQLTFVRISTKGPYAVAHVDARPGHEHVFQPAWLLLRSAHGRWKVVADILHEACPGVPRAVIDDLAPFNAALRNDCGRS
jgi:hypothetical protein